MGNTDCANGQYGRKKFIETLHLGKRSSWYGMQNELEKNKTEGGAELESG